MGENNFIMGDKGKIDQNFKITFFWFLGFFGHPHKNSREVPTGPSNHDLLFLVGQCIVVAVLKQTSFRSFRE